MGAVTERHPYSKGARPGSPVARRAGAVIIPVPACISSELVKLVNLKQLCYEDIYILWAGLLAMVHDIHAAQDNLTPEQWDRAEILFRELDKLVNEMPKSL